MFCRLDESKLDDVLSRLRSMLATKFTASLAKWFCTYWRYLEEQTFTLLKYLSEQSISADLSADIATISTMVNIKDVTEYFTLTEGFSQFSAFK